MNYYICNAHQYIHNDIYTKILYRISIRLRGYDYSQQGLYFITICTQNRACLFGFIEHSSMMLDDSGKMVQNQWLQMTKRFTNIVLHEYIIMPNHIHVILEIVPTVGAPLVVALDNKNVDAHNKTNTDAPKNISTQNQKCNQQQLGQSKPHQLGQPHIKQLGQPQGIAPTITIGNIIGAFKSITTHEYIRGVTNNHWKPFDGKLWQRNYYEHIIPIVIIN